MIPSRLALAGKKQHYAAKILQNKVKGSKCMFNNSSRCKSSSSGPETSNNISCDHTFTAAAAAAVMTLTFLSISKNERDSRSHLVSQPCQCDTITKGSSSLTFDQSQKSTSTAISEKGKVKKNQPRNVMVHRLRSLRGRSLNEKYNVDWKEVLGEGAYGSVHPARLAATGEKVSILSRHFFHTMECLFCCVVYCKKKGNLIRNIESISFFYNRLH